MNVRYRVQLSEQERGELQTLLGGGRQAVRKVRRAQVLLAADAGASDEAIARDIGVGISTVYRVKQRFVEGNLEWALNEQPRPGARRKSRARRQRCWWPPPARRHRVGARGGRWSCWRERWCG